MSLNQRHQLSLTRDRGAVLPLALVLVVVLGAVGAAIATYTATTLRASDVSVKSVDRIAAAESGATFALQATAAADACDVFTGSLNGAATTSTCSFQRRAVNADGLYALVVTDLATGGYTEFDAGNCPNPNCTRRISGPIYLDAGVDLDLQETQAVFPGVSPPYSGGNVSFNPTGGDCGANVEPERQTILSAWDHVDEENGSADVTPFVFCDSRGWDDVAPTPDTAGLALPTNPVTEGSTSTVYSEPSGDCEVFTPGIVTSDLTIRTDALFLSGVYHFEDSLVTLERQGSAGPEITVGTRSDAPYQPTQISDACAEALANPLNLITDAGDGAVWVMSGTSRVIFDRTVDVDFYPRDLGAASTDLDISMLAMHTGPLPVTTLDPATVALIERRNPTQTKFTFHGQLYAPRSFVDSGNASGGAEIQFLGGLVVGRLTLQTAANVAGLNISVPVETFDYYLIESTATNDGETTVRVVAFDDGSGTGLQVESWRVCERQGC